MPGLPRPARYAWLTPACSVCLAYPGLLGMPGLPRPARYAWLTPACSVCLAYPGLLGMPGLPRPARYAWLTLACSVCLAYPGLLGMPGLPRPARCAWLLKLVGIKSQQFFIILYIHQRLCTLCNQLIPYPASIIYYIMSTFNYVIYHGHLYIIITKNYISEDNVIHAHALNIHAHAP